MEITVVNMVVCNDVVVGAETHLHGPGLRWQRPPERFGVWLEFANPREV